MVRTEWGTGFLAVTANTLKTVLRLGVRTDLYHVQDVRYP